MDRVQAQLWPSPFPSPERTRTAPGQTEVPSPLFSGDDTRRLQAIQDRAPLLYGSSPQPQNPTPSSTSLSAEAIQAEVQRQLGPLVEHVQRLERLNEHLQQQASPAFASCSTRTVQSNRIVLHLFSGKKEKFRRLEGGGRLVLSIDLENGQDIRHPVLWKVLVKMCMQVKVDAVVGGPPCRTFSILRHRPPGPLPLRSRAHPYGLPQLGDGDRDYVNQDTAYFVRFVYLHSLATAKRDGLREMMFGQKRWRWLWSNLRILMTTSTRRVSFEEKFQLSGRRLSGRFTSRRA